VGGDFRTNERGLTIQEHSVGADAMIRGDAPFQISLMQPISHRLISLSPGLNREAQGNP
jgi:hypothetical protein